MSEAYHAASDGGRLGGPPADNKVRRGEVVRVIDGDTLDVRLDLLFHIGATVRVRLSGIDCPERGTREGTVARLFVSNLFDRMAAELDGDRCPIVVRSVGWDRLRCLAEVWLADGRNLADVLVSEGHARRVNG